MTPRFLYDFADPECYLALERLVEVLGVVPELVPVRGRELPLDPTAFRCAEEETAFVTDLGRRVAERGLQPLRWPARWPPEGDLALRVATYCKGIGKVAAFSLAAFRQAYAAGRDLDDPDTVLIAAAACEMHPAAVLKGAELKGTTAALDRATADAREAGVRRLPALVTEDEVFEGDAGLEQAAEAAARAR